MIRATLFKSAMLAGLLGAPMLAAPLPAAAFVSVGISVGIAPPALPVYEQPIAPGPGYIWTPGYWAWDPAYGYYWVPGAWVQPPEIGVLWTPGWWGWDTGYYRWHPGYWGPSVGFYGGINYGYGYFGLGYVGGHWRGHDFYYNRAVNNINVTNIRNVYVDKTVVNNYHNATVTRVSYNGGRGGVAARATPAQLAAEKQRHFDPTPLQLRQRDMAKSAPAQRFSVNHGRPEVVATPRPGNFASAHAVRNETKTAPHMAKSMTPHAAPSAARPSDGFVHAPHAASGMPPHTSGRTTSHTAPMKQPSDNFVHAPHAAAGTAPRGSERTTSHTAPMKESSDNFVHAPHAAAGTAPRGSERTTSHTAPMKESSDNFVHAPHANSAKQSRDEARPPHNEAMPPRADYQRQPAPRQMPQHQAKPYAMPQQNRAPSGPEANRKPPSHKPPSKHDHQNDDGH